MKLLAQIAINFESSGFCDLCLKLENSTLSKFIHIVKSHYNISDPRLIDAFVNALLTELLKKKSKFSKINIPFIFSY